MFISGGESLYQPENEKGSKKMKAIIKKVISNLCENVQDGDKDIELKNKMPRGEGGEG